MIFVFSGNNVKKFFNQEIGNHRFQRVPPTERRGRVHTSSITIAVLDINEKKEVNIDYSEIERIYTKGTGPDGQHKNKTETCVILKHIPTQISVRIDGRSRKQNEKEAWKILKERIQELQDSNLQTKNFKIKRDQVGNGTRGDKRRTYRLQDDKVIDHITKKKTSYKNILKGKIKLLHE